MYVVKEDDRDNNIQYDLKILFVIINSII